MSYLPSVTRSGWPKNASVAGMIHSTYTCIWVVPSGMDSEGPDQPLHPRSLIKAFIFRSQNYWILQNISMYICITKDLIRLCGFAGSSGSFYCSHMPLRHIFFSWRAPYNVFDSCITPSLNHVVAFITSGMSYI